MPRTARRLAAGVSAAVLAGVSGVVLTAAPIGAATVTESFEFTGEPETFTVPADVCEVTIDARGAEGGASTGDNNATGSGPGARVAGNGITGGLGARATATLPVTPGETLDVFVGGAGEPADGADGGAGGLPDGGPGGDAGVTPSAFDAGGPGASLGAWVGPPPPGPTVGGGGGGGSSSVQASGAGDRAVIAGGGGGTGGNSQSGGGGGGETGEPGGGLGGGGGTQTEGGAGGGNGTAGQSGLGGSGGDAFLAVPFRVWTGASIGFLGGVQEASFGGGGGGGGFFGGGGGSGTGALVTAEVGGPGKSVGFSVNGRVGSGGGGGGSGFTPDGTGMQTGVRSGDGLVTISYDDSGASCPAPTGPAAAPEAAPAPPAAVTVEPRLTG